MTAAGNRAQQIFEDFLKKREKVQKRRTARLKTFLTSTAENLEELASAEIDDEHELSEAAQLSMAALYDIVKEIDDSRSD